MNVYSLNGVLIVVSSHNLEPIELSWLGAAFESHGLPYLIFAPNAVRSGPHA